MENKEPVTLDEAFVLSVITGKEKPQPILHQMRELDNKMAPFADNKHWEGLVERQYPNEPDDIKTYRKEVFDNPTTSPYGNILLKFQSLNRVAKFKPHFPEAPSYLSEENNLEYYCNHLEEYDGVENATLWDWMFVSRLKSLLSYGNSFTVVIPKGESEANEMNAPQPMIVYSDEVRYFDIEEGIIFRKQDYVYCVDYFHVAKYEIEHTQDAKGVPGIRLITEWAIPNPIQCLPIVQAKGKKKAEYEHATTYEALLSDVRPALNRLIKQSTSRDALEALHLYGEKVMPEEEPCVTCGGSGQVQGVFPDANCTDANGITTPRYDRCGTCGGGGKVAASPFRNHVYRTGLPGEQPLPNPPVYYVDKPEFPLKYTQEAFEKAIANAYESVGLGFMADIPLDQSGKAKEVDRSESEGSMNVVANFLVNHYRNVAYLIALWRYYPALESDKKSIVAMVPTVPIPERFDVVTADLIQAEINASTDARAKLLLQAEKDKKQFGESSNQYKVSQLVYELHPLPSLTTDDILAGKASNTIADNDAFLALNIVKIANQLLEQDAEILEKSYAEKQNALTPIIASMKPSVRVVIPPVA